MADLNEHMAREEADLQFLTTKDAKPPEEEEMDLISEADVERNFNVRPTGGLPRSGRITPTLDDAPTLDDLLGEQNLIVCIYFFSLRSGGSKNVSGCVCLLCFFVSFAIFGVLG